MDGYSFWAIATIAAMLVGVSKGGLPIVGMLAVPVLSLKISPVTAAGLLLPVYVVSDVFGVWAYRKAFDRRVLAILVPSMILGVGVGWATAHLMPEWMVTMVVGLIGVAFVANYTLRKKPGGEARQAKVAPGVFWGSLSGFTSFVSHAGAPPYQVYVLPLNLPKAVFAGTTTIAFAIINAVKLVPYYFLGQLNPSSMVVALYLMPAAALAVFIGVKVVKRMSEKLFFRLVLTALALVSIKLIWDGAVAGGLIG